MSSFSAPDTNPGLMEPSIFRPRALAWSVVALAAVIALFDLTYLDLTAQDVFFNFDTGFWLIDSRTASPWAKLIFYDGIKAAIILLAVLLIVLGSLPRRAVLHCHARLPRWLSWMRPTLLWKRRDTWVVIATLAAAPLLVSIGKATTNIHYPCSIQRYGGDTPYVRLFERFPDDAKPAKRSRGFPAGHASGGFALVSLAGLAATRRGRLIGVSIGLSLGWVMGVYQQMRGVHYLSHTLVTMLVCWIVFLLWRRAAIAIEKRVTASDAGIAVPKTIPCHGNERTWSRDLLVLGLLCLVWFCVTLGMRALNNPDEGRYAEIPREMAASGDYVTPRLNGVKYFEKPPLLYWLSAVTFKTVGVNPFTARLWNALFAVSGVLATYCAARALHGRLAGWCSAVVLATSLLYFGLSQIVLLDMAVAVTMSGALLAFLLAVRLPPGKGRRLLFWTFYACMALAVLAKGLIGFVLPCAVAFVWLLCLNQWRSLRPCHPFSGALVLLAIAAPWHVLATLQNHSAIKEHDFAWFYFIHEHYLRFTTTVHRREQPWWFFGPVLVLGFFPWVVFAVQSLKNALAGGWRMRKANREAWFLVIWIVLIVLFFSKSQSKLIPYILPVFPAAAILIGSYLAKVWAAAQATPGLRRGLWVFVIAALVLAACVAAVPAPRKYADIASAIIMYRWILSGALVAGALFMMRGLLSRKIREARGGHRILLLVMAASFGVVLALFNPIARNVNPRTTREIALALKPVLSPGESVYCLGYYPQDFPFYLDRVVSVVNYRGELEFGIDAEAELTASRFMDAETFRSRWEQPAIAYAVVARNALGKWFPDASTRPAILAETLRFVLVANRYDAPLKPVHPVSQP